MNDPLLLSLLEIKKVDEEKDRTQVGEEEKKVHKLVSFLLSSNRNNSDTTVVNRIGRQIQDRSKKIMNRTFAKKTDKDMFSNFATEIN